MHEAHAVVMDFIIYKDPMNDLHAYIYHCLHVQVWLSLIQFICYDAKGEGGGGPELNVIMTLIFKK